LNLEPDYSPRESDIRNLPSSPRASIRRSANRAATSMTLALVFSAMMLVLAMMIGLCGLIGALPLKQAVYMSGVLLFIAALLLRGVWNGAFVNSNWTNRQQESYLCSVEVEVDAETQLTVRSWWPSSLEISEVRANGMRVAMENAERWFATNRSFYVPEICFDETLLEQAIPEHLCSCNNHHATCQTSNEDENQCAVCFDDMNSDSCTLRLCGHRVHLDCLLAWFKSSRRLTCPMCRCDHSSLLPSEVLLQKQQSSSSNSPPLRVVHIRIQRAVLPPPSPPSLAPEADIFAHL